MLKYFRWPSRQRKLNSQKVFDIETALAHKFMVRKVARFEHTTLELVHCYSSFSMSIRSYFKPKDGLPDPKGLLSTCLLIGAKKGVEKAIADKSLGKKRGHYIIVVVPSDTASSFILFHALLKP